MAYPASVKTHQQWVQDIDRQASILKAGAQQQKAQSLAGQLDIYSTVRFFDLLVQSNVFFIAAEAVTGLAAYLVTQKQSQVADPIAEFVAMRAAVVTTLDWLRTNLPEGNFGGNNYKLAILMPAGNVTPSSPLTVTAAQSATYRTVLDSLIATIS